MIRRVGFVPLKRPGATTSVPANLSADMTSITADTTLYTADYEYPKSIAASGLLAVFQLSTNSGLSAPGSLATPSAGNCPGASISPGVSVTWTSGTQSISNVDFTGYTVYLRNTANITFTNCKFKPPAAGVAIWHDTGTPTSSYTRCLIDLNGAGKVLEAPVYGNGTFSFSYCYFTGAPADFISVGSGASSSLTVTDCYFTAIATVPGLSHIELVHFWNGTMTFRRVFVDFIQQAGGFGRNATDNGGWTGSLRPEPVNSSASITWIADQCIIRGASNGGLSASYFNTPPYSVAYAQPNWNIQFNVGPLSAPNNGTMTNCVLDTGTSGYVSKGTASFTHSGNIDYYTGLSIEGSLP